MIALTVGHAGHSAYSFCPLCHFCGSVCGCKALPNEAPPSRIANYSRRNPFSVPTLSHGVSRPKRPGEHIVYLDKIPLSEEHGRSETVFRASQRNLWHRLQSPDSTLKAIDSFKKKSGVSSLSALTLASPDHFNITTGVSLDG